MIYQTYIVPQESLRFYDKPFSLVHYLVWSSLFQKLVIVIFVEVIIFHKLAKLTPSKEFI
jgi:hypothetical protein